MADLLLRKEGALLPEGPVDLGVGLEDELPREKPHLVGEAALVIHGGVCVQAVPEADLVVFPAVAWRAARFRADPGGAAIAAMAAASSGISTKPKPLALPVTRSTMMFTEPTSPYWAKRFRRLVSVVP